MKKELLIEFFDRENLENLISLSADRYSRVIYLYFPSEGAPEPQEQQILTRFIQRRFDMPVAFVPVEEVSLRAICGTFDRILKDIPSCVIDLTGGSEIFSAAAGYYAAHGKNKLITLQQYDPR